jgi:hypothetical protein
MLLMLHDVTVAEAGKAAAACFARSAMSLALDAEDRLKLLRTDAAQSLMLTLNANAAAQVLLSWINRCCCAQHTAL